MWWTRVTERAGAPERLEMMVDAVLGRRLLHDRLTAQTERIRKYISDDLRPGLSVDQAGQRYGVLASPELYYLLTIELGWTADKHRSWLTELLKTELLAPPSATHRRRRRRPAPGTSR
jgi:hypothetical protein